MKLTTLCYLEKEDYILMLHRTKKKTDGNAGKWIGVGGKLETDESPNDCILREIKEETGLIPRSVKLRGILTFILPTWGNEMTFLYTSNDFEGEITECDEGELKWIGKDEIMHLDLWQGDRYFLDDLINTDDFICMKLIYDEVGNLLQCLKE